MVDQRMALMGHQSVAGVNGADISGWFAYGSVQVALPSDGDGENLIKSRSTEWTGSLKLLTGDNSIHNRRPSAFTQFALSGFFTVCSMNQLQKCSNDALIQSGTILDAILTPKNTFFVNTFFCERTEINNRKYWLFKQTNKQTTNRNICPWYYKIRSGCECCGLTGLWH